METSTRPKRDFLSAVVHDLRNPLVPILGYADMLYRGRLGDLSQKQRDGLSVILRNCRRLQDLVDELLTWIRFREGRRVIDPETFELRPLLEEIFEELRAQAEDRSVRFELDLSGTGRVFADRGAVRRVLSGLLGLALKATYRGAAIHVKASPAGERVAVEFQYAGPDLSTDLRWDLAEAVMASHHTILRSQDLPDGDCRVSFDLEAKK